MRPAPRFDVRQILAQPGIQLLAMRRQQADRQRVVEPLAQTLEHTT
jgi:hypothetical protein